MLINSRPVMCTGQEVPQEASSLPVPPPPPRPVINSPCYMPRSGKHVSAVRLQWS